MDRTTMMRTKGMKTGLHQVLCFTTPHPPKSINQSIHSLMNRSMDDCLSILCAGWVLLCKCGDPRTHAGPMSPRRLRTRPLLCFCLAFLFLFSRKVRKVFFCLKLQDTVKLSHDLPCSTGPLQVFVIGLFCFPPRPPSKATQSGLPLIERSEKRPVETSSAACLWSSSETVARRTTTA